MKSPPGKAWGFEGVSGERARGASLLLRHNDDGWRAIKVACISESESESETCESNEDKFG